LLAQVLAASTYPQEIVQLHQWLPKNKQLKDKQLADAVLKENWDPSVQGLAPFPDLVKQLFDNIKWTSELGNAFLAQPGPGRGPAVREVPPALAAPVAAL
jgi:Protein of unknown function (DUF3300)